LISGEHYGEIWEVDGEHMSLSRTLRLWRDRGVRGLDGGGSLGPGVPNFITSLRIDPHGEWLWYTAVKMDTNRGLFFDQNTGLNLPFSHDSMVRPMLGRFDLRDNDNREPGVNTWENARIDADNADSPSALVFSPRGNYVFAAMQGNNLVSVFDDLAVRSGGGRSSVARLETGQAPRGLAWDSATDSLWVQNFLSRDLTRINTTSFLASGDRSLPTEHFSSTLFEPLPADVLAGKQIFFFAGNHPEGVNEISFEGYVSCASCHLDGGHDGRTWDFTQRGEGLRNTHDLRGRAGMQHGNVHWTGNFDEIQDFALEIIADFGGLGFLPEDELPHPPLGTANAGRSPALDQLAAYVGSLGRESLPRSPFRSANGQMSQSAMEGAEIFTRLGCASCHAPHSDYTDATRPSATLHDVGTLRSSSGKRLGQALTGISTPTLLGIWDTEPYLHDGSAADLKDVFSVTGGTIHQAEDARLSGGAEIPGFIEINWDSTAHGRLVRMGREGATVTFERVDGGNGGPGAVELRFLPGSTGEFSLRVNGSPPELIGFSRQNTHFEWSRARVEGLALDPGQTNTIEVQLTASRGGWPALDHLTVSTSTELELADPHRIATTLSAPDQDRLSSYLRQLDGRDTAGRPGRRELIFRDSFR
jgi:hypothetical protein